LKVFTYKQYIDCIHTLRLNAVLQLAEEGTQYNLNKKENKYSHDKLFKNILKDKKEAEIFINQFLEPRVEIKAEDLVRYTNSYITKKYKSKEADLVYKLKNQEIFFLIEHQSTIDNRMPYRILNYCIDIMQEWCRNRKIKKNTAYPIIVPIVIYTGNEKWKLPKNFREKQISNYVFERYKIDLEYNLIDINKISKEVLLEKQTMFGYIMFIEKSQTKEELIENLEVIIKSTKNKEKLEEIASIISYLLDNVLEQGIQEELSEKIERKVGEKSMSTLYDRLRAENRRLINQGKKEGKIEGKIEGKKEGEREEKRAIVKKMLNKKLDDEIILETTNIGKEELEKIKNKLAIAN